MDVDGGVEAGDDLMRWCRSCFEDNVVGCLRRRRGCFCSQTRGWEQLSTCTSGDCWLQDCVSEGEERRKIVGRDERRRSLKLTKIGLRKRK